MYKRTAPRIELKSLRRKPELRLTSFLVIIFASKRFLIDSACVSYQDFFGNEIKLLLLMMHNKYIPIALMTHDRS